jgi:7-keto-8-aminopelargonate synthetase-like enzyme
MTEPEPLQQLRGARVRWRGRTLSFFSGCDYFRLSSHPRVAAAVISGLKKYGLNVAASRLTTGNHVLYQELEHRLADFFQAESALLVPAGYLTNLVVAQAFEGHFSHALIDECAHPSLVDAARFLEAPVVTFKHRDSTDLALNVHRCGPHARLVVLTDGMFSRDGSAAPLSEYLHVLPNDATIIVDDSHGAGVLGRRGRGTPEFAGVSRRRIIQTITLSKAFGAYGGVILGPPRLRRLIIEHSRLFAGATPLPLPLANAALESLRILVKDKSMRKRLFRNVNDAKSRLRNAGVPAGSTPGPIISIKPRNSGAASLLRHKLLDAGIYPSFIRYPAGPADGYFRFVFSSEHNQSQIDSLILVLEGCHDTDWIPA